MADKDDEIARLVAALRRGSIVAAAGCGKTEQIARAVGFCSHRRLILTHTHAGVDVLTQRLARHAISPGKYRIDTIAAWCLRFAASYPARSGLTSPVPSGDDWNNVYIAAARLLDSGAIQNVLFNSYGGVFVDEYQDCSKLQHEVIRRIANILPTCIFGDPMQAIFDFDGTPVDWTIDVFPEFAQAGELQFPWRWENAGNRQFAEWLVTARNLLQTGGVLDFTNLPKGVTWETLPTEPRFRSAAVTNGCYRSLAGVGDDRFVLIADSANEGGRAAIAKQLAKRGLSNIEPIGCAALRRAAQDIERARGERRLKAVMKFLSGCMVGTEESPFLKAVDAHCNGRAQGRKKFGTLIDLGSAVIERESYETVRSLMRAMGERPTTRIFRREMFYAMCSALHICATREGTSLTDAVWEVQNRIRHAGRRVSLRSVGSTLLVKGLEFEHGMIVHAPNMSRRDWYVALTRATRTLRVLSSQRRFSVTA